MKKKKISMFRLNFAEFWSLCKSLIDYKIDEDLEDMKNLAEVLINHPLDEATKAGILEKNGLSIYDLEEAICFSPRAEEDETRLARCLEDADEILSYNRV